MDTYNTQKQNYSVQHNDQDSSATNDCTRGQAIPVIKRSVFPKTTFQLQKDRITGIETVNLDNDNKLIIKNWGCEYYCLTFRFETNRFQNDTTNLKYWFEKTLILMDEVKNGVDAPVNIEKGITAMKKYYDTSGAVNLKLKDEIYCDKEVIMEFVIFDRVEKLTGDKYAIEVTFALGPL